MKSFESPSLPKLILYAALALTSALYWAGLSGPFLFDDQPNFSVIQQWLAGQATWQKVVLGHQSLLLARPVAMASFLLTASIGGAASFYFKLGNLMVHLGCGLVAWQVLRRCMRVDRGLAAHADLTASIVVSLWLLHPLHVSTVLYSVQRMAQLSAFFTLAALWTYLYCRQAYSYREHRKALFGLFMMFPLLVIAGVLSKQNAIIAPALCLVFELAYFTNNSRRPRPILLFFAMFLFVPALLLSGVLIMQWDYLLRGYTDYDFTLGERVLSQPRALLDYVGQLLLPRGPLMGLYTDDFPTSSSWLSPWTTLPSIIALTGVSVLAILWRKRAPSVFAGWFFFLVAHGVESSFLPLDLYFEHRNYLPAVGLLLSMAGFTGMLFKHLRPATGTRPLWGLVIPALVVVLAFATLGRVLVWQSMRGIVDQGLKHHPLSLRANLDKAALAIKSGDDETHDRILLELTRREIPRERLIGRIYLVAVGCKRGTPGDPSVLKLAVADASPQVTLAEVHAFSVLSNTSKANGCGTVTPDAIAGAITGVADAASMQPDDRQPKWMLRFIAANMYVRAGQWQNAQTQSELSWQPTSDPGAGALLAQIYARNGLKTKAIQSLREAEGRVKPYDTGNIDKLRQLEALIRTAP